MTNRPNNVTSLNLPVVPLGLYPMDTADPGYYLRQLEGELTRARMNVVQLHSLTGVAQFDLRAADTPRDVLDAAFALAERGQHHHVIAVASWMAKPQTIYLELEAETERGMEEDYRCALPTPDEIVLAVEGGHPSERLVAETLLHRRDEIAEVVASIVLRKHYGDVHELDTKAAAVEFLATIDHLVAKASRSLAVELGIMTVP